MAKKENVASVLAFEKKLVVSDGYMYGTSWTERSQIVPLALREKSVRGTISNRLKAAIKNDPAKLNAEVEKANLQRVDACALAPEHDTLNLQFTIKVLGVLPSHPLVTMHCSNKVTAQRQQPTLKTKVLPS
ncbi:CRISPR-associated protein Cas5 [Shewanella putrefaciens]|nr:CRISPR-associated protein Cas5 [Shewanella putrefaciens]